MEEHFPHIVQQMREKIKGYGDNKMEFRRLMIRNELICCMEVKRFAVDSVILKGGDVSNVSI